MDIIRHIMLSPLLLNTKFIMSTGLSQMLKHKGLFLGLLSRDPPNYLYNVVFNIKSMIRSQNLSMDSVGLQVFLLFLTGEAIIWLLEVAYFSIYVCADIQKAFHIDFPKSKKLKLKDYINNFQEASTKSISSTLERFIK